MLFFVLMIYIQRQGVYINYTYKIFMGRFSLAVFVSDDVTASSHKVSLMQQVDQYL